MAPKLSIYFDGLCPLCSREIDHYRKQRGSDLLRFVDITLPEFDAAAEGVDPVAVHKVMHVRTAAGELKTGVDSFIAIWESLPAYRVVARVAKWAPASFLLNVGYQGFARVRPLLPRRKRQDCAASPYCETRPKP